MTYPRSNYNFVNKFWKLPSLPLFLVVQLTSYFLEYRGLQSCCWCRFIWPTYLGLHVLFIANEALVLLSTTRHFSFPCWNCQQFERWKLQVPISKCSRNENGAIWRFFLGKMKCRKNSSNWLGFLPFLRMVQFDKFLSEFFSIFFILHNFFFHM